MRRKKIAQKMWENERERDLQTDVVNNEMPSRKKRNLKSSSVKYVGKCFLKKKCIESGNEF
jgi:hypothetical protein